MPKQQEINQDSVKYTISLMPEYVTFTVISISFCICYHCGSMIIIFVEPVVLWKIVLEIG